MSGQKRHFPYYSAVPEIELKKRGVMGIHPGRECMEPRTFIPGQTLATATYGEVTEVPTLSTKCTLEVRWRTVAQGHMFVQGHMTNFAAWTEPEIKVTLKFLGSPC